MVAVMATAYSRDLPRKTTSVATDTTAAASNPPRDCVAAKPSVRTAIAASTAALEPSLGRGGPLDGVARALEAATGESDDDRCDRSEHEAREDHPDVRPR